MNGGVSLGPVRAQVAAVRERSPDARVIGIRLPELRWNVPTLRVGDEDLPVASCASVLELRARLVEVQEAGPPLVILTDLEPTALGADVLARLAHRKLFRIDPWQLVKERFRARYVDPRLVERHAWVARALLEAEPPDGGYAPVPSGFLEAETAWRHAFERLAGIPDGQSDPDTLLAWALDAKPAEKLGGLCAECREGLVAAVQERSGPAARAIFECAGRLGPRAFSVGLVVPVLFGSADPGDARPARARGRLEALLGLGDLDPDVARVWGSAAELDGLTMRLAMGLFADQMLGTAFESGLSNLKELAEKEADAGGAADIPSDE